MSTQILPSPDHPSPRPPIARLSREQVRAEMRVYMSRSGLSFSDLAERSGFARQTLRQFASRARFGASIEMGKTTQALAAFLRDNPPELPEFPCQRDGSSGRIYPTESMRAMRRLIDDAREGIWGTLYAPHGTQKTVLLEQLVAESARAPVPWFALVNAVECMWPRQLLAEIARAIAAPYAQYTTPLRESILYAVRRRKSPVVVVVDEAQLLYPMIDTLECLRRLGDLSHGYMGLIVSGNEEVVKLFEARKRTSMGQWRSRVEQRRLRVYGPTEGEARDIAQQEFGGTLSARQLDFLVGKSQDTDPLPDENGQRRKYINLRRMFNAMRDYRREKRKVN